MLFFFFLNWAAYKSKQNKWIIELFVVIISQTLALYKMSKNNTILSTYR